jgi:hypothetical protein
MFGESESESPRVPSPWDSFISIPSPPIQGQGRSHTPSPLAAELIPRLVPEADDGNVEYKLQLLSPSPARFARLVTQMKWRLLEGGGQAYYELGVADSGDLIGLPREELEQSLETLEMMAGEIGASVIVVKEIEVPAALASLAKRSGEWAGAASRRAGRQTDSVSLEGGYTTPDAGTTETETDIDSCSGTDYLSAEDTEDLSVTVVLEKNAKPSPRRDSSSSLIPMFPMDSDQELDPADAADDERLTVQTRFSIDLEISSVFKPRPMRPRIHNNPHYAHLAGGKNKRTKKHKHLSMLSSTNTYVTSGQDDPHNHQSHGPEYSSSNHKGHNRRQGRDKRREEKRKALEAHATQAVDTADDLSRQDTLIPASSTTIDTDVLIVGLESLHVGLVEEPSSITNEHAASGQVTDEFDDDNDIFSTPLTAIPSFPTFSASDTAESHLDAAVIDIVGAMGATGGEKEQQSRLIVEALVVRKMSMEEAFLDFGGFSLT